MFAIDEIVGWNFIVPDDSLHGKLVKLIHINGNNRDNHIENLKWIEDIEVWKNAICPIVQKNGSILYMRTGDYKVSSKGRVFSNLINEEIYPVVDTSYYRIAVRLYRNGSPFITRRVKLHRMLAFSFNIPGRDDNRTFINHIDGNKLNVSLKNLEWCTNRENVQHSFAVQLEVNPSGEYHPRAKFTDNQRTCIYEIIKELSDLQPSHVTGFIRRRLPRITRDDVKYAKNLIKKNEGFKFPDLSNLWKNPRILTAEERNMYISKVDDIFDKYGITETQFYENKYQKSKMEGN